MASIERATGTMRSPVGWALLGLVIQRPSYGYELVQRFERTYGDALELSSPSQIYSSLDGLKRRQLIEEMRVESHEEDGVVRQPKPHYRATPEGIAGYQEWLISQMQEERRRSRLFARELAVLDPDNALAVIERCEQEFLREASKMPARAQDDGNAIDGGGVAAKLLLEEDRLAVGARLSFIEYARREMKARRSGRRGSS